MNIDSLMYYLNPVKQKGGVLSYIAMPLENNFYKYYNYTNVISDDDYLKLRSSIGPSEFFNLFKNEVTLNNDGESFILSSIKQIDAFDIYLKSKGYIFVCLNKKTPEILYYFIPESSIEYWIDTMKYAEVTP